MLPVICLCYLLSSLFVPVHPSVDVAGIFEKRLIQDEVERGPFPKGNLFFILTWCAPFSMLSDKYDLVFRIFSFYFVWGKGGREVTVVHLIW